MSANTIYCNFMGSDNDEDVGVAMIVLQQPTEPLTALDHAATLVDPAGEDGQQELPRLQNEAHQGTRDAESG